MGKVNLAIEGFEFKQTGEQIQKILDTVELLNMTDTKELLELLKDIKEYDNSDDEQDIGHQLVNALNNMVSEKEVQISVNDSKYPPSSQAVKTVIEDEARERIKQDDALYTDLHAEIGNRIYADSQLGDEMTTHASTSPIDHPDGSVTSSKIAAGAIHEEHIEDGAVTRATLSTDVYQLILGKIDQSDIKDLLSNILSAPLYKLSSFLWNAIYFRIPINENSDNPFFYVQCDDLYPEETYDKNYEYISLPYDDEKAYVLTGNRLNLGGTYLCRIIVSPQSGVEGYDGEIEVYQCNGDLLSGRWHYGTALTHTEYTSQQTSIVAQKGDFYLNTNTYGVYYTLNGTGDWTYIGNLAGSIDASKWAALNSPVFTGKPTAPTASISDNSQQIATTEFVRDAIERYGSKSVDLTGYAPIQNPHFTGVPTAPTPSTTNNSTQIATTEYVRDAIETYNNNGSLSFNIDDFYGDVYGVSQNANSINVSVQYEFSLSFKCTQYDHTHGAPQGTWGCADITDLYGSIFINGHELETHSAPEMQINGISVSDSYLENNIWEIIAIINLNPDDIDSYPVYALCGSESNMIYSQPLISYPRVVGVSDTTLKIALGTITLPDHDVVVGGTEVTLTVPKRDFDFSKDTSVTYGDNSKLTTKDKSSLVAAINELVSRVAKLEQG